MQGTQVQSLVLEDPTYLGATKPMCHNYQAQALKPVLHNKRSRRNQKAAHHKEEYTANPHQLQQEKAQGQEPEQSKINFKNNNNFLKIKVKYIPMI